MLIDSNQYICNLISIYQIAVNEANKAIYP